jgi:hypothetical protein
MQGILPINGNGIFKAIYVPVLKECQIQSDMT